MIPRLTIGQRMIAWLLWRFEGFDSVEGAEFEVMHPEFLRCYSLLQDYWYVKKAKLHEKGER